VAQEVAEIEGKGSTIPVAVRTTSSPSSNPSIDALGKMVVSESKE
jgi:hypothetical protein